MRAALLLVVAACGRIGFDPAADEQPRIDTYEFGACFTRGPGDILCWGENGSGQAIEGTTSAPLAFPTRVPAIPDAIDFGRGEDATCVARGTGAVECWGRNDSGQLGMVSPERLARAVVPGANDIVRIDSADFSVYARRANGEWLGWGQNSNGELADGTVDDRFAATLLPMLDGATRITADQYHACGVWEDGALRCWGRNDFGTLGIGTNESPFPIPQRVLGGEGARDVAMGIFHTCAIFADTRVHCWGWNNYGQLGVPALDLTNVPVEVPGTEGAESLVAGEDFTCFQRAGQITCWGRIFDSFNLGPTHTLIAGAEHVTHMSAGLGHVCFERDDADTVYCFGDGDSGQLGDGSSDRLDARPILLP